MYKFKVVYKRKSKGYHHFIVEAPDYLTAADWVKTNAADFDYVMAVHWVDYE